MPWFITTVVSEQKQNRSHCFGFYNTYNDARTAIDNNTGSMEECLYDYLVLEYIEEGIHPTVHVTEWYIWIENSGWEFIQTVMIPMELKYVTNWALG